MHRSQRALSILFIAALSASSSVLAQATEPPGILHFEWSPGHEFEGDLAIVLTVDWGEQNTCEIWVQSAGRQDQPGLVDYDSTAEIYSAGFTHSAGDKLIEVHAGDLDTRDYSLYNDGYWWSGLLGRTVPLDGQAEWLFAAFGTLSWTGGPNNQTFVPFSLSIDCQEPFKIVQLAGGTNVVRFDQNYLEGSGARVSAPAGDVQANLADGVSARFTEPRVRVDLASMDAHGITNGVLTVNTPVAQHVCPLPATTGRSCIVDGPPGEYDVRLDAVSMGLNTRVAGVLAGLWPVEHLDEVVS